MNDRNEYLVKKKKVTLKKTTKLSAATISDAFHLYGQRTWKGADFANSKYATLEWGLF